MIRSSAAARDIHTLFFYQIGRLLHGVTQYAPQHACILTSITAVLRCCFFFAACCFTLIKLLAKLHRIQAYVRRSTAAKARFAEAQRFCELTPGALPGACPTRWWSTTTSVQAFVKNERAVKMLCDWAIVSAKKDNIPILTEHDWIVRVVYATFSHEFALLF